MPRKNSSGADGSNQARGSARSRKPSQSPELIGKDAGLNAATPKIHSEEDDRDNSLLKEQIIEFPQAANSSGSSIRVAGEKPRAGLIVNVTHDSVPNTGSEVFDTPQFRRDINMTGAPDSIQSDPQARTLYL